MNAHADVMGINAANSGPLELRLDLIDEDPSQPRTRNNPGFSIKSLSELAASIRLRGVKTPISVRVNPSAPGRYIINHGARRFRASRLAGRDTIPGFIDNDYSRSDQVVENLHRNELTAREIADFIGRQLAQGMRKSEIARSISKSPAFITQYVILLDLPEPIALAFNQGRVKDVTVTGELVKAYRKGAEDVSRWLADESNEITRGAVRMLREFLDQKAQANQIAAHDNCQSTQFEADELPLDGCLPPTALQLIPWINPVLVAQYDGRRCRLLMRRRPTEEGHAWVRFEDSCELADVPLSDMVLVALAEG